MKTPEEVSSSRMNNVCVLRFLKFKVLYLLFLSVFFTDEDDGAEEAPEDDALWLSSSARPSKLRLSLVLPKFTICFFLEKNSDHR